MTDTDDLVKWLRPQIDVDANWAYAASARERVEGSEWRWDKHAVFANGGDHIADAIRSTAVAGHIAHHDPARVRREVEAKRLLLGMWEDAERRRHLSEGVYEGRDQDEQESDVAVADALDGVIRALALPYADQPGYQEAWKP
jgi:hypothetical protein